jgi:nicotinamidase-related amidase
MKKALIVVDYQNDFVDGALGFLGAENIAGNIYSLVAKAVANKDFIVFKTRDEMNDYLNSF